MEDYIEYGPMMATQLFFLPRRERVHSASVVLGKFTRLFCTDESYTLPSLFAAVLLRRCKYKKYLANNIQCGPFFYKTTPFFLKLATSYRFFLHFFALFVCYTLFFWCFCLQMYETNIKKGRNSATISSISLFFILGVVHQSKINEIVSSNSLIISCNLGLSLRDIIAMKFIWPSIFPSAV